VIIIGLSVLRLQIFMQPCDGAIVGYDVKVIVCESGRDYSLSL